MDLGIVGRHALLFDDDAYASFVNSRAALVPWTGDESLLIDRYDVRHLIDRIPPRPKKHRFVEETVGVSQSELDRERFLDLPLDNDDYGGDERDKETTERLEATGSGSYQAVPFSYGNKDGLADPDSSGSNHSAFQPPFPVPTSLVNNLVSVTCAPSFFHAWTSILPDGVDISCSSIAINASPVTTAIVIQGALFSYGSRF